MAWLVGTPRGRRKSTNAPSRTPRPLNEIGSTWAMATAGTYAMIGAHPTWMPRAWAAIHAATTIDS